MSNTSSSNRDSAVDSALEETTRLLSGINLFSQLAARDLLGLASRSRLVQVPRREVLVNNGQRLNELQCLVEGVVKVYLLSCSGQQRVISLLHPGESIGEALLLQNQPSPFFAEALTPARLLILPVKDVQDLLITNTTAGMNMIQLLSQKVLTLLQDLEGCCLQNALQRIAQYLCSLDVQTHKEIKTIELPASKAVVASLLNLSAESLSRGLHQLAAEGLISIRRRQIDLHQPTQLQEIASGELQLTNHAS